MTQRWIILTLLLLALVPEALIVPSWAQPVHVTVGQSSATIKMNLLLQENLTSLPSISIYLTESNSSTILQPITQAVQRLVPSGAIESFELRAHTSNSSAMWSLVENYSITVTGVTTNLGSTVRSRVDFVRMNVSQSLTVLGQELNAVGSAYLLASLNAQNPKTTGYYIDGHQTLTATIPAQTTTTFWLLDFTWVPMVSTWPKTHDFLKQTTIWSLDLGSPRYNLTLGTKSPEGPLIGVHTAIYYPTFTVAVPANAWADGNTISFDLATPSEVLMPTLTIVSIAGLIIALFWDRRLTTIQRRSKKKR